MRHMVFSHGESVIYVHVIYKDNITVPQRFLVEKKWKEIAWFKEKKWSKPQIIIVWGLLYSFSLNYAISFHNWKKVPTCFRGLKKSLFLLGYASSISSNLNLNCVLVTRVVDKLSPGPMTKGQSPDPIELVNLAQQSSAPNPKD